MLQFNLQRYVLLAKKLFQEVPKHDRELFTSSTILLHYWVIERHSSRRVMKQFGLRQVVPPPFYLRIKRVEHAEHMVIDYNSYDDEVSSLWDARKENVLHGQKDFSDEHRDFYLVWFLFNTILNIGLRRGRTNSSIIHFYIAKNTKIEWREGRI